MTRLIETDVLVIGEGSGGQTAALTAQESGADTVLLYNGQASSTAISTGFLTYAAHEDFPQNVVLKEMSQTTGKGLCDMDLLRRLVSDAPEEMERIFVDYEVPREKAPRGYRVSRSTGMRGKDLLDGSYGKDGAKDMTGLVMEFSSTHGTALFSQLRKAVKASPVRRIKGTALSLLPNGPSVWADIDGEAVKIVARAVILATGGIQGVYDFTDTPKNLLGDGQSMALEAGAELVDMEFIQFYPLAVNEPGVPAIFLYPDYPSTARLTNTDDEDLIVKYMGENQTALAALHNWDYLSFIIQQEIIEGREVFIDFRETTSDDWAPDSLTATFLSKYIEDYRTRPVRIAPSSHYTIGGIKIDRDGQTSIPGVYAVGEVSGGLHGANRHGGTALVEAMTFGRIAGRHAAANLRPPTNNNQTLEDAPPSHKDGKSVNGDELLMKLRKLNQYALGAARNDDLLSEADQKLKEMKTSAQELGWNNLEEFAEVQRLNRVITLSQAMCLSMRRRTESRGTHMRIDYPETVENWTRKQIVQLDKNSNLEVVDQPVG